MHHMLRVSEHMPTRLALNNILRMSRCICNSLRKWFALHFPVNFCYIYRLHKLFVGNGADGIKPSFQRLITASGSGISVNMEHGHQVC